MDQSALYDGEEVVTRRYKFKVNQGGEIGYVTGEGYGDVGKVSVIITFENGKFKGVQFSHDPAHHIRGAWHVLKQVAEKIEEIEEQLKNGS